MRINSEKKLKALVIAPQPFFTPRGTPFSVYYRTLVTAELGVQSDFLTYGQGRDVYIPNVKFIRIPAFKSLGDVKVGPSYLKLFLDIFLFSKLLMLLLRKRYDFVHAHEEAIFFALLLKPIFKFKLIYDMHSSLPQQLKNFRFTENKLIVRLFNFLENQGLKKADAVITICPDLKNYVDKVLDKAPKNHLIENSIFDPVHLIEDGNCANDFDNKDEHIERIMGFKHRIVYAGTLEKYQGIDILIQSIPNVVHKNKSVLFIIVGGTAEQVKTYKKLADDLNIAKHIIFTGRVSQIKAKYYTKQATVLVSPRSSGTNTPLKIYEQLASGIPIVATNIYSHSQVLTSDVAFLVDPEPLALARGILSAIASDETARGKACNAKLLYEREYSRAMYIHKMKNVLKAVSECAE